MSLQPHQQRVVDEKTELDEMLSKLLQFTTTAVFRDLEESEKGLLKAQAAAMQTYSSVLAARISAFKP